MKYAEMVSPGMVDDEPALRYYLTRMARDAGYAVTPDARIEARVVSDVFEPDIRVGMADIVVTSSSAD